MPDIGHWTSDIRCQMNIFPTLGRTYRILEEKQSDIRSGCWTCSNLNSPNMSCLSCCGSMKLEQSQLLIQSIDWFWFIDWLDSQDQCNFLTRSITLRCKALEDKIQRGIHMSKNFNNSGIKSVLRDQRAYHTSLTDRMTLRFVRRLQKGLDPTNPALSVAGLDHPITSKNQSRSNRGTQGCLITSCDVMFNAEILHRGRNVNQQPTWTGQTAWVCSDTCLSHFPQALGIFTFYYLLGHHLGLKGRSVMVAWSVLSQNNQVTFQKPCGIEYL
jgi:hypothetical protein